MGIFERFLSIWVALAIIIGIVFGLVAPELFVMISKLQYGNVNFVIALFIWMMIYPMMLKVELDSLKKVHQKPKALGLTIIINWLIKPFTMAAIAYFTMKFLFASFIGAQDAEQYIAGMILLGVAPCTAMVFVWSQLTKGDAAYTLVQVSINDLILIFAFAPISALLLGLTDLTVPWITLFASVITFVVVPLVFGVLTQKVFSGEQKHQKIDNLAEKLKPLSIISLLMTVVLLFGFQAQTIIHKPIVVLLISIPLIIQSYGIFALAYYLAKLLKLPHNLAAPAAMIGSSNFFELAVAVAISLFGLNSGAALATVVGVLIEVPVMLSLVAFANKTRSYFPAE